MKLNCLVETTNNCWVRGYSVPCNRIPPKDGFPSIAPKGTNLLITFSDKHPSCPFLIGALILEGKPIPKYYGSYYTGHECKVIGENFFKNVQTIYRDEKNEESFVISDSNTIFDIGKDKITIFKKEG